MTITKRYRQKIRSYLWPDMKPAAFDKLIAYLPHVLCGMNLP